MPGAAAAAIARCEREIGAALPADLKAFLLESDGYNGPVGTGYLVLWGTSELAALSTGYALGGGLARIVLIGSNAGPTAYGVDRVCTLPRYVSVPFLASDWAEVRELGVNFAGFVAAVAAGEGW